MKGVARLVGPDLASSKYPVATENLIAFPGGAHDDFVDATVQVWFLKT
jgi:phage terminase large subunit-like protein